MTDRKAPELLKGSTVEGRYRQCIGSCLWPHAPLQRIELILIVEKRPSLGLVKDGLESLEFEVTLQQMERTNIFTGYMVDRQHLPRKCMSMKHVAFRCVFVTSLKIKLILELICHCNVKVNEHVQ